ncbi:TonB-dependent receptor [Siculibacillus lacustris]|uniref:TonB-dependent receptor n=1 Tax=Siculibacillus lacustris TaxID=1549641 RepID=A0A4Q9VPD0_9HYPH|nr:TonB-dependent receptor [Siculibacillus lacustris]TBW36762.1 TonB-dependent receptor [Siculibacillus lacustris]
MGTFPQFDRQVRRGALASGVGLLAALAGLTATRADEVPPAGSLDLGTVVISANRTPTEDAAVGSSVTVITRREIEKSGESTVKDLLDRVPGLGFSQAGPAGSQTTMQIRGLSARYVLVRIDGVDVADPTQPQMTAGLEHLLLGDVERIEILRGSQSALYGGTAVGGVIDITTRTSEEKGVHHSAAAMAGSYGTASGRYGFSAANDTVEVNTAIERFRSAGFSSADSHKGNREADGYDNTTFSANGSGRIAEGFKVFGALRYSRHESNYDDFAYDWMTGLGHPADETTARRFHTIGEEIGGRVGADFDAFDGRLKNTVAVQAYRITRDVYDSYPGHFEGNRAKAEYLGVLRLTDAVGLSFGLDRTHETARTSDDLSGGIDNTGVFSQLSWQPIAGLTLTGALRDDHHSMFGDHPTHRLTAAYDLAEGTKLRTSWGTGFRPPSIYELYAPFYGNRALKPESSGSFDVGIDHRFWGGRASVSATWFHVTTDNLIDYDTRTWAYAQVPGTSTREGVELTGRVRPLDQLTLDAGYTYTDARAGTGARLMRVPLHKATFGAALTPFERTTATLRGTWVADSVDTDYSVGAVRRLPSYFLLDAGLAYQIDDHVTVSLTGKNLLDRRYETIWGYGTAGAAVYAALNVRY